ncbi:MAG TPA: hypothetical protein ENN51_08480 [candidate division WOR-3 bacterium]|uniref:Uncharacterized protein n=1 Tax=candidate division WOR-3 bacterium TaxID=2052148 RepID=A0A7V0T7K3_UNCW3|nr:hypothetical protein [candidate division WOR-3 bacterium]
MKADVTLLPARLSQSDRTLVAAAIRSHSNEIRADGTAPAPLGYRTRRSSSRYLNGVRQLERRLRATAATLDRWRVIIEPQVEVTSLRAVYQQCQMVPPVAIRRQFTRSEFLLVRLQGKLTVAGGVPVRSLRLGLELDPGLAFKPRRGIFYAVFPKAEGRLFRGAQVALGLRPNLTFWVPRAPGGTALGEIPASVRKMMLLGPMKMAFRKLVPVGAGSGSNRADWILVAGRESFRTARFELMAVLRVARGRTRVKTRVALDAEVTMPGNLSGVLGRTRYLRGVGNWSLPVPKSLVRTPSRPE